jgi:hypothetical protein
MEKKNKGRPTKSASKRKRLQYSVWVSAEEKQQIDKLIDASNLSASQFFLTLAINKPFERPKKKTLPKGVAEQISNLEKLSGLLALSALKTKDKLMLAESWQRSSQTVKWITRLISLWIFAEFDLPSFKQNLKLIEEKSKFLYWQLDTLIGSYDKAEIVGVISQINQITNELITSFGKQFEANNPSIFQTIWQEDFDVHQEIEQLKQNLLKQ